MKSPGDLKMRLRRQWESPDTRESRLLDQEAWPIQLSIGKPSATTIGGDYGAVKQHLEAWRRIDVGEVRWESVQYRATAAPVDIPVRWILHKPSEWITVAADSTMRKEFASLSLLVEKSDSLMHPILIRRRSLWREKPLVEVVQASKLAMALEPGCAAGRPLRTLSLEGIDTKFFERNSRLVTSLLDVRFDGEVSRLGLETFLGAFVEGSHWLLVVDLDGSLLPFPRQRVASSDLPDVHLPGARLLIVENETCYHQLPELPETIAILGAGFDLDWTASGGFKNKSVGYWGDIDTWGLQFLAKARSNLPHIKALMMSEQIYDAHHRQTVAEPVVAGTDVPDGLLADEQKLYHRLLKEPLGRLEQEFVPSDVVCASLNKWAGPQI